MQVQTEHRSRKIERATPSIDDREHSSAHLEENSKVTSKFENVLLQINHEHIM